MAKEFREIDQGHERENELARILSQPLLQDFVHLRPPTREGRKTRELCDLLIEFDSMAIVVQLKTRRNKPRGQQRVISGTIKDLKHAARQAIGAAAALKNQPIFIENLVRGNLTFQPGQFRCRHAICLTEFITEPTQDFVRIPDLLPRRGRDGVTVHYLSFEDFITLCTELITLPDLVSYLDQRAQIPAWATPDFGRERDTYARYLLNDGKLGSVVTRDDLVGSWDELNGSHEKKVLWKREQDDKIRLYNDLILQIRKCDPIIYFGPEGNEVSNPSEVRAHLHDVTRTLNSENRLSRRMITERLIEKLNLARDSHKGFNFFVHLTEDMKTAVVFVASRRTRQERYNTLANLCYCASVKTGCKHIVGVATEPFSDSKERSFDFASLHLEEIPDDQNIIDLTRGLMGEMKWERVSDFPGSPSVLGL